MAVPEQTPYKEYTANGVTTSFPLEFDCDNQDHLIVTVNDIEPENGQWSLINGAVVFLLAPANQAKIIIQRNTPLERNTDYQTYNNSFRPQPVNKDLDRIWWKLQELWVQVSLLWTQIKLLWSGLKNEIKDRIAADLAIRSWVLVLLNNIVDSGLVSAIAVTTVESISDLNNLIAWDGRTVYVKSYYQGLNKGGGTRIYNYSRRNENDGFLCIDGWVLQVVNNTVTCSQAGAKNDVSFDSSDAIQRALLYSGVTVIDSYFYTSKAVWFPISKIIRGIGMWSCGIVKTGNGVLNLVHDKSNGKTTLDKNAVLVGYAERSNSSYNEDCHLSDFSLRYAGGQSNSIGLYVPSTCRSRYSNILVEDCNVGYQTSDSWLMTLTMFHVRNSRIAFYNGAPDGTIGINGTSNHYVNTYAEVCSEVAYYFDTYQYSSMSSCAADKMSSTASSVFKLNNTDIVITGQGCEQIVTKLFDVSNFSTVTVDGGQYLLDNRFKKSSSWSSALFNLTNNSKLIAINPKLTISTDTSTANIAGFAVVNNGSIFEINNASIYGGGLIGSIIDNGDFINFSALDIKIWSGSVAKMLTPYGGVEQRSQNDLPEFLVGFKTPNRILDTFLDIKTTGYVNSRARSLPQSYSLNDLLSENVTGVMGQSFWSSAGTSQGYPTNNEVAIIHQMNIMKNSQSGSIPYTVQMCFSGTSGIQYRYKVDQNAISAWYLFRTSKNTTVDANGFVKSASPIVNLFANGIELNDEAELQMIEFEKIGTGDYLIKGSLGFAQEGWYIEMPKDANGNVLVAVVYEQLSNNDISVKTYAKKFDEETGDVVPNLSKPRDIPESRWITLRLQELPKPEQEIEPVN